MRISDWSSDVCSSDLEQQVKRSLHACDTEKPLRSAGARQKTDIDLGQSYDRFRIIDKNAVMRRQCQFEPAAECKTIDNRNPGLRSEEHTSELQSLMRISYSVFCLKKKKNFSTLTSPSFILHH